MKHLQFTVTVSFTEKITSDNDIMEIAKNIADAIKEKADGSGIAPDGSDGFTTKVQVTPQFLDETIEIVLYNEKTIG